MLLEAISVSRYHHQGEQEAPALTEISLSLLPGELLVVTGPSGSGKSTLLNILSGLDRPTTGDVRFAGKSLARMDDLEIARLRNASFGFIFQTPHLLFDRTVAENVALPFLYGERICKRQADDRCRELLRYVGLESFAARYPNTLSGGEMQRVVFARALTRYPQIIFADEPTGSLDIDNSRRIVALLQEQVQLGCTVVLVTHDKAAAAEGTRYVELAKMKDESL